MEAFSMYIVLAVMALFVILMLSGKFSFSQVGMTCVAILVLTKVLTPQQGFAGFTNKNVIMLLGMFVIAGQFGRTRIVSVLKKRLSSAKGGSDFKIALLMLVFTAIFAQFIPSQTSIIMIMMTFLAAISGSDSEVTTSRMLLPITFLATLWMGRLPIGSGLTSHLMFNQFIEASGSDRVLDVFSLPKCTIIPAVICLIYCLFTYKYLPKRDVSLAAYNSRPQPGVGDAPAISSKDEILIYAAFIVSLVALVCTNQLGDLAYFIPFASVLVLVYLKVVSERDVLMSVVNGPVIMCASILVLADAMTASGAGDLVGSSILNALGGHPAPIVILIVFSLTALILTSFVSNTACMMVLIPVGCNVCVTAGYDPRAVVISVFLCSVMSVITPMSSGGAAMAYSTVKLSIRDTIKWTVPLSLLGMIATIINCYIVYPM